MISIVIPVYNKANNVCNTVQSVLNQTYTQFELVLINDGSTDNSLEVLSNIKDYRIKIINQENQGVSAARNIGFKIAKYNYVAFLDGDDFWTENHLENAMEMIECYKNDDEVSCFSSNFIKIKNASELPVDCLEKPFYKIEDYFEVAYRKSLIFPSTAILVKSKVFEVLSMTPFSEKYKIGEDTFLWYTLFSKSKLVYSEKTTVGYYTAGENRAMTKKTPANLRFHKFNFKAKSKSEKRYLEKLAALVILDYFLSKDYKQFVKFLFYYKKQIIGISRYYFLKASNQI